MAVLVEPQHVVGKLADALSDLQTLKRYPHPTDEYGRHLAICITELEKLMAVCDTFLVGPMRRVVGGKD